MVASPTDNAFTGALTKTQHSEHHRMKRVIYLGPSEGFVAAREALSGVAEVLHKEPDQNEVARALERAYGLIDASMKVHLTSEMVQNARYLRVVSCATTGADHLARDALDARGIQVRTLKEDPDLLENLTPAAELSWALLMACSRKLTGAANHVLDGLWDRESFPGTMLNGRRLGLLGCGRIGGWMARYAHSFGMEVIGYDPYLEAFPDTIRPASLEEVFSTADFVSVHVHLSSETRGLVSKRLFDLMKPDSFFINTSRGAIADETALLEALASGHLGGAALDVLSGEPEIAQHPLVAYARHYNNLVITPHCGGFSPDAVRKVCQHAATKVRTVLEANQ